MKVAVSMWSVVEDFQQGKTSTERFIRKMKELGADGVELLDFFWRDRGGEMDGVKAALKETGLPVCTWAVGNDFADPDPAKRKEALQTVLGGVDEAVNLGAKVIRVFSGSLREGVKFDDAFGWIVEGLKAGADYAAKRGVTLGLENHGLLAGRSDQIKTILKRVGSPALRANIDTGNFLLVNQPAHEATADLAKLTVSVHLKDFKAVPSDSGGRALDALDGSKFVGAVIGEGDVYLRSCLQSLKDGGYKGYLSIEYEGEDEAVPSILKSIENTRHILSQLK